MLTFPYDTAAKEYRYRPEYRRYRRRLPFPQLDRGYVAYLDKQLAQQGISTQPINWSR